MFSKLLILYFIFNIFLGLKFAFFDFKEIMQDEEAISIMSSLPEEYHLIITITAFTFVLISLLLAGVLFKILDLILEFTGGD